MEVRLRHFKAARDQVVQIVALVEGHHYEVALKLLRNCNNGSELSDRQKAFLNRLCLQVSTNILKENYRLDIGIEFAKHAFELSKATGNQDFKEKSLKILIQINIEVQGWSSVLICCDLLAVKDFKVRFCELLALSRLNATNKELFNGL